MTIVVAIDAGTTGARTIAFDERAHAVAMSRREFPQYFPAPGWVEHDAAEIWEAVQATLGDVCARLDEPPAAIGVTNQRETVVRWSRSRSEPLERAIVWQDRRTAARCAELEAEGLLPLVRERTGLVLDPYFSASKLEWLLRDTAVPLNSDLAVGTIDSWIVWNLTGGALHATDATNASRTMLFDIGALAWSSELCEVFGVPMGALPEVRPSSGDFGITASTASCGAGVPIRGVAGDQQAALFGQAAFRPGDAKNTYGTGSFVLMNVGSAPPEPTEGLLTTVAWLLGESVGPEVAYALEGAIFATGATVQWLRDGLGIIEDASEIELLAAQCSSTGEVFLVPAFTGLGSPHWDPHARGTIVGLTRGTGRPEIARAAIEAMVYQTRDVVEAMTTATGTGLRSLRVDGGASAMDSMLQLQADHLGVPVRRPKFQEVTALGAAYLAGLAAGIWPSTEAIGEQWQLDLSVEPNPSRATVDAAYANWKRAVERSRNWAT
ncbi:MAG: glycerol kinase GlpK [bacterium]|nr:glycerol kinase GlpK [bacterium]